jgi:hypothetical protein
MNNLISSIKGNLLYTGGVSVESVMEPPRVAPGYQDFHNSFMTEGGWYDIWGPEPDFEAEMAPETKETNDAMPPPVRFDGKQAFTVMLLVGAGYLIAKKI